jgi:hypothetical protein
VNYPPSRKEITSKKAQKKAPTEADAFLTRKDTVAIERCNDGYNRINYLITRSNH